MLSHEVSIIATKERAEMKMIECFIPRELSLMALGIQSQSAVIRKVSYLRGLCGNRLTITAATTAARIVCSTN